MEMKQGLCQYLCVDIADCLLEKSGTVNHDGNPTYGSCGAFWYASAYAYVKGKWSGTCKRRNDDTGRLVENKLSVKAEYKYRQNVIIS